MNYSILSLFIFAIFALVAALPALPPPLTQRNIPTPAVLQIISEETPPSPSPSPSPSAHIVTCGTSTASPTISTLQTVLTLFSATCNPLMPLKVAHSKACISLIATDTVTIDLCGWDAEITCADAEQEIQSVLDQCASGSGSGQGRAAGDVDWEGRTVRVHRIIRIT